MADLVTQAAAGSVDILVIVCGLVGVAFASLYSYHTSLIVVDPKRPFEDEEGLLNGEKKRDIAQKVYDISKAISEGAEAFLFKEYQYMGVFMFLFGTILLVFLGIRATWWDGIFTTVAFLAGATTSIVAGLIGMRIAVFANSRTALEASKGYSQAFNVSFKAGCVMGFALTSLGLLVLFAVTKILNLVWPLAYDPENGYQATVEMYEAIAGFGLGGSSIALFGRVGGGIYTKAADVGADLVGKCEFGLEEDDPRNPACIADNVGDNVGDVAGMGADLFGSFAEASCATMVIASQSEDLFHNYGAMCLPMVLFAAGILVCLLTSFVATHLWQVNAQDDIEPSLKRQLMVSTILMTPVGYFICAWLLPAEFHVMHHSGIIKNWYIFGCFACGLWSGLIIGYITEYYTSHSYTPVRDVAKSCETGAATNIIYGLALGYKSVIIPTVCLAVTIFVSYSKGGMFGISVAALGILSTMPIGLTIDSYGPICDNAGGIAEMSGMPSTVRERTDALDAAGNTTAAIGKGFAIGSAALVSLALFGAFVTTVGLSEVNILQPYQFAGLLIGAMMPYWFSAMTMKSVGKAALEMVEEVRRQFREHPEILDGEYEPDHARCIAISTEASLREMIAPGALVMLTPLVIGFLFGVECLAGELAGALVSGVQMAISSSNTGGAWDNAKKYIEAGNLGPDPKTGRERGKGSDEHHAAVIGDTVGDPLKDTSGPALNILIKLSAIISLVFARAFPTLEEGGFLTRLLG